MYAVECASCGGRFQAKRRAAKYCSDRCRKRASRAPAPLPPRREGAPLVTLPRGDGSSTVGRGLLALTRAALEAAGRLETWEGAAAVALATILDSEVQDTGSSIAALIREHRTAMSVALDGATAAETPLEKIRRERELKAG